MIAKKNETKEETFFEKSFCPSAYRFYPSESEVAAQLLMFSINYATKRLFEINLVFNIGVVSDRIDSFCEVFAYIYP